MMEPCVHLNCERELRRLKGEDSNAIILPAKKKNKKKGTKQVSEKLKRENKSELSKSQRRKLKKLEEEKEKALLLSKSIETLEKYKIREDACSLMWSSRNLGQVETVREKRRRGVQFSKVGLELPHSDRPFKRRASNTESCEPNNKEIGSGEICGGSDSLQPIIEEREVPLDTSISLGCSWELICRNRTDSVSDMSAAICVQEVANEKSDTSMVADPQNSMLKGSSGDQETVKSTDRVNESPKVDISSTSNLDNCPPERALTTPTIVHVSRPKELEDKRKDLPIVMMEQEIMEAINENISIIICGETGCGKTTQVPQFLYEAGFGSEQSTIHSGIIGVTQPRRVAVLATAKRVAYELGLRLGKEVGFQVRHDRRIGDSCSIKFMTDGILLRELQSDFLLKRYSILILDEAHERSLNTDILIGMLSRIIQERQKIYEEQKTYEVLSGKKLNPENKITPLKLVLMSATLRVEDFVSGRRIFRETPPVIEVPTRQYPVTVHFSKRTEIVDYVGQAYKKVLSIHKRLPAGGILVFVTGQREVEYLCRMLRKASREMVENNSKRANESSAVSEPIEDYDTKEIHEAFEIQGNSSYQQTDRFSSYDGDHGELSDNESDFSYDSEEDSDLEAFGDERDLLNQETPNSESDLANALGEDGNLAVLKSAFESLSGENKNTSKPADSEGKQVPPVTPEGLNKSNLSSGGIKGDAKVGALCVLPLYAMLPALAQLRVFEAVKEGERLVVVATNVAETSLTIPGIKYVVDTGREKVKNFNSSNGMETYEIQWISKASAAQRAGRAGRTGPGHCYRLYSSAVFNNIFLDFSSAEITKIPVDGVVLLMKSMGIAKVANFPFPTPPNVTALIEAERCLKTLEALNSEGSLTPLGKAMALYPMSPRHSRMLLTVIQIMKKVKGLKRPNLVLGYTVAAAAALSLSNPFVIQFEGAGVDDKSRTVEDGEKVLDKEEKLKKKKRKETAKVYRAKFSNPTSDALTVAYALQCFELAESQVEFCNHYALHPKTMEEMSKLRKQLLNLVFNQSSDLQHEFSWTYGTMEDVECEWRVSSDKPPLLLNEEELLGQAICAGWADRVAKRIKVHSGLSEGDRKVNAVRYQACMVGETVFLHRWSSVSKFSPEFLVYSELLHSKRPYIHGATSVKPDWLVKYAGSLCTFSAPLADPKPYYEPMTDKVYCWVSPTFGPYLWLLPLHSFPIKDDMNRVAVFAFSLLGGHVLPCLGSVRKFMAASPASILRPEASGHKRVGNLLYKLKTRSRTVDCCAMLREVWSENPLELYSEILDWFQEGFHWQFEELWSEMHREVVLDPRKRFPKMVKKDKK
ncbi:hypothetical protein LguiA_011349 [Lonicera macranthoides]